VIAIAAFPYLKPEGKNAFHTSAFQGIGDLWPSAISLVGLVLCQFCFPPFAWQTAFWGMMIGSSLSVAISYWFYHQFNGMTGDVYGAIVEWTEALILCCLTLI